MHQSATRALIRNGLGEGKIAGLRSLQSDDIAGIQAIYGLPENGGPGDEVPIPAPAIIFLIGTGLVGIAAFRFRKKIRKN
jgi:hypothetical protein